jgi:hypothetical protein
MRASVSIDHTVPVFPVSSGTVRLPVAEVLVLPLLVMQQLRFRPRL